MRIHVSRCEEVLIALRRLIRAIDLHSRQLVRSHGLTAPQSLIWKEIVSYGEISVVQLAQRVSLSQATAGGVNASSEVAQAVADAEQPSSAGTDETSSP